MQLSFRSGKTGLKVDSAVEGWRDGHHDLAGDQCAVLSLDDDGVVVLANALCGGVETHVELVCETPGEGFGAADDAVLLGAALVFRTESRPPPERK